MLITEQHKISPDTLHIGLDLGGDTLKISFAYVDDEGEIKYGKFIGYSKFTDVALPAHAYYDYDAGKWFFADEIDRQKSDAFVTVVKIKNLLSLLTMPEVEIPTNERDRLLYRKNREIMRLTWERNKEYYFNENSFPKFYFPVRKEALKDFEQMVNSGMTFEVPNCTPQTVCKQFFEYIFDLVNNRKSELEASLERSFTKMNLALVHPMNVGEDYIAELSDIIYKTFGSKPSKVLSSVKALALYAKHKNVVKTNESFLVFDLGEESISVAQATIMKGKVVIDGVEGHSSPLDIGGNDVDRAIVSFFENEINGRETFGTPSAGSTGHISEGSIYAKQYQLMKDVKKAKIIFSKKNMGEVFDDGVPITFSREVLVQRTLTSEAFKKSLQESRISKRIINYMLGELKRPINRKVKEVFISGGPTETYSLLDYVRSAFEEEGIDTPVCTFEEGTEHSDSIFDILSYEDSVFAPSVGGAIVSILNIEVPTVLSLTYGSWVKNTDSNDIILNIFANRGDIIGANGSEFLTYEGFKLEKQGVENEEIYSTTWSREDIEEAAKQSSSRLPFTRDYTGAKKYLIIGPPAQRSRERSIVESETEGIGLKIVSGGNDGKIYLTFQGERVILPQGVKIFAKEGIKVDKYGRATPIIINTTSGSTANALVPVQVYTIGNVGQQVMTGHKTVRLGDIKPVFKGVDEFGTSIS